MQTQDFTSLNPAYVSGVGGQELAALLYSYLVKIDDRGRLVPDAAREVPTQRNGGISRDGLTLTYRLRSGIHFSDGRPLTAADVVYTIGRVADTATDIPSRIGFDDVTNVRALDPLTVRVRLARPFAPIILYLCGPGNAVAIVPRDGFGSAPIGSGPYVVERWDRDDRLELRANARYFGGRPNIDRILIRFMGSSTTAMQTLVSREADAYVNADDSQYEALRALRNVRVDDVPIDGTGALIFNTQDATFRDVRVRRAFAMALNPASIVEKTLGGAGRAAAPGRGLFLWAYDPSAYAMPSYDPRAAATLLSGAGYAAVPDGTRAKDGRPLTADLIVRSDKPSNAEMATQIQAAARLVGFTVSIRRLAVSTLVAPNGPLYGGSYQVALFPFIAGFDPDVTDQFACNRVPPNGFNKPRYCNRRLDSLLARAASTYDRRTRTRLYRNIETILARELPLDALYQAMSINAFPKSLTGQTTAVNSPFWNVRAWKW
ncbi:MAG: ABC transporter substrate-binding protein [Candidatus Eremiobacteraeota bacterium]|nr:ABC transporter substrate-binding protein [Candidatus Eremiobacteraeota bacterium]